MSDITFLPISSNVVSTDTGVPIRFSITNTSKETVTLYWVDRAGKEVAYASLNAGGTYSQSSVSSHVWELKSADGNVGFKFAPSAAGMITIGSDYKPSFSDFSEKVTQTSDGLWSTAQGYGLINVAKSLGIAETVDLPVNGQNNNLALNAIEAPSAWAAGYTGKGVTVAVIDIGIAASSEINKSIVGGYDFYQNDTDAAPNEGTYKDHALGVASIIAASHTAHKGQDTKGVAPDAGLMNIRVGSSVTGSGSDAIAKGIMYAVDHGAKVICMPLENTANGTDQNVVDAVHYAYQHNVVTVIIGGNYSNYGATGPALIAQQLKGEAIDVGNYNVMTGSPFDSSNQPGATPFPWVMASSSGYVANSTGGYTYWGDGGTSFAGPYVAGLAALLFQQSPNATATEIMNKIIHGASVGENAATANLGQSIVGTAANDILMAVSGASVDGGSGIDHLVFNDVSTHYSVTSTGSGFTVTNNIDHTVNSLVGVERLQFTDHNVILDANGNGGEVFRLYQAAFNRAPEASGLGFWLNAMDNGMSLDNIAKSFTTSAEFIKLYGEHPSNEQLVNAMYQNVLHRAPEQGGHDFWIAALEHGTTVTQMLTSFSDSGENVAAAAVIIGQGVAYTPFHG